MDQRRRTELSKFLSYVLRHDPQAIGLRLGEGGWADVEELIRRSASAGRVFTLNDVQIVVATSDKQRFTLSDDHQLIRAAQGHSLAVELGLKHVAPPHFLFHGTSVEAVELIMRDGLSPRRRQHVHLSGDASTARTVGARHGKPVVLRVRAGELHQLGTKFYRAENGVWLTQHVAPDYLSIEPR